MDYFKAIPESTTGTNGWRCKDAILLQPKKAQPAYTARLRQSNLPRGGDAVARVAGWRRLLPQEKLQVPFPARGQRSGVGAHPESESTLPGSNPAPPTVTVQP